MLIKAILVSLAVLHTPTALARKRTKVDKSHEVKKGAKEAPTLEELQSEEKVAAHEQKLDKDIKDAKKNRRGGSKKGGGGGIFGRKNKEEDKPAAKKEKIEDKEADGDAGKKEDLDWDFFFDQDTFDEETELRMDSEEWNLMDEWSEYMSDFIPEDMTMFELKPKKTETAFEAIEEGEMEYIRGAYFVKGDKNIDFYITDPTKNVIFSRRNAHEGIFRFNTTAAGHYKFIFTSKEAKDTFDVTLALHTESLNPKPKIEKVKVDNDEMHPELDSLQTLLISMKREVKSLQSF
jgi:hypothetical protein